MTGKRKSRKKPIPKKKTIQPLPKQFDCPFCQQSESCEVKIDNDRKVGRIICRICMEDFQTRTHHLSMPIDVYNDWIDACEECN